VMLENVVFSFLVLALVSILSSSFLDACRDINLKQIFRSERSKD